MTGASSADGVDVDKVKSTRQPAAFFCHGGGPLPILRDPGHKVMVSPETKADPRFPITRINISDFQLSLILLS